MEEDDFLFDGISDPMHASMNRKVSLLRVGQEPGAKEAVTLYLEPSVNLKAFFKHAAERLGVNDVSRIVNMDGNVIQDLVLVENGAVIYAMTSEDQDVTAAESCRLSSGSAAGLGLEGTKLGLSGSRLGSTTHDLSSQSGERVGSYLLGKFLGQGSFGKVHLGKHVMSHEEVALKFISKHRMGSYEDAERVFTEIQCLNSLDHPNVIKLLQVVQTPDDMVLALEFARGGDLKEIVEQGAIPEDLASHLFVQILEGVTYCHRHHVIHYDLKLENILLQEQKRNEILSTHSEEEKDGEEEQIEVEEKTRKSESDENATSIDGALQHPLLQRILYSQVKITDFGLSKLCNPGQTSSYAAGSLAYIAPEVFEGKETAGPPRDVWALGVILFAMVCGRLPFAGNTLPEISGNIRKAKFVIKDSDNISESCKQLIAGMLQPKPHERMTLAELRLMSWIDRGLPHTRAADSHGSGASKHSQPQPGSPQQKHRIVRTHEGDSPAGDCGNSDLSKTQSRPKTSSRRCRLTELDAKLQRRPSTSSNIDRKGNSRNALPIIPK